MHAAPVGVLRLQLSMKERCLAVIQRGHLQVTVGRHWTEGRAGAADAAGEESTSRFGAHEKGNDFSDAMSVLHASFVRLLCAVVTMMDTGVHSDQRASDHIASWRVWTQNIDTKLEVAAGTGPWALHLCTCKALMEHTSELPQNMTTEPLASVQLTW
jgi:hypothetical protein